MERHSLRQRLRYAFDNTMARGPSALIGWLAAVSATLILIFSLIVILGQFAPMDSNGHRPGFIHQLLYSFEHAIDGGTLAGDNGKWYFLVAMLLLTLGGIFVVSILIGVLTAGLEGRIEQLRKGRSLVLESNHTLVLGWNEQIFTILRELAAANDSERRAAAVVLADEDRIDMEDSIRERVGDTGRMRVVCRSGSPIDLSDLKIVNPQGAKSVIVLTPKAEDPDPEVIKTVLAVRTLRSGGSPFHVVAELHDTRHREAAKLVGGDNTLWVDVDDTIARLIVQTSRQPGLPVVYTELLDFDGDEIYLNPDPALDGKTFGDALLAYERGAVMGIRRASDDTVLLGPPPDTVLAAGDDLIVVAEDDSALVNPLPSQAAIDTAAISTAAVPPDGPEQLVLLGWNRRGPAIIRNLAEYVEPGSNLVVVADVDGAEQAVTAVAQTVPNLAVTYRKGDTTDRATLDALEMDRFKHVIVLCYEDDLDVQRADAKTLVTLLQLRDIEAQKGERYSVVSEMLDDRNRELAEVTAVDDFIVSERLLSLLLSQVSENRHLMAVFADLFDAGGNEIYLEPIEHYVRTDGEVNFATLIAAARRRGEVALGWRVADQARDADKGYGIVVNPAKSATFAPSTGDRAIVLTER